MTKCIYCGQDRSASHFSRPEHIVPQAFGRFRQNLTLRNKVCSDCNQHFGDHLETWLARDTYEGLLRFEFGLKNPRDFKHMGASSTLKIRVAEGPFRGAAGRLEHSPDPQKLVLKPLPQVGFKIRGTGEYEYLTASELRTIASLDTQRYDLSDPRAFVILGMTPNDAGELLSSVGLEFEAKGTVHVPEDSDEGFPTEVTTAVTNAVERCIAKIGFNYLARWNSVETVLCAAFDPIRQWIRYGKEPAIPLVHMEEPAILGDEPTEGWRRLGHIVAVEANTYKDAVLAKVSLFNQMTYKVLVCWDTIPEGLNLEKGHFFNLSDMSVLELSPRKRAP